MTIQTEADVVKALIAWHKDSEGKASLPSLLDCERVLHRMTREEATLRKLAAFHDESANKHLEITGSYALFDEPNAVRLSRETLKKREIE